jgi:hypothetical protein
MLEAAAEQKSIKRVVLTSSSAAAIFPKPNVEGIVVTEGKSKMFAFFYHTQLHPFPPPSHNLLHR